MIDIKKLPAHDGVFDEEYFWAIFKLMSYHTGREMVELRNKNRVARRMLLKEGMEEEYKHFLSNQEQTSREAATQEMTMFVFESAKCQIVKFYAALDEYTKSESDKA